LKLYTETNYKYFRARYYDLDIDYTNYLKKRFVKSALANIPL